MIHARITNLDSGKEMLMQGKAFIGLAIKDDGPTLHVTGIGECSYMEKAVAGAALLEMFTSGLIGDIIMLYMAWKLRRNKDKFIEVLK